MPNNPPQASAGEQQFAAVIAMVIRNSMEDFHCEHLSDDQMKQLNPINRASAVSG